MADGRELFPMNNETWTRVDQYLAGQLLQPDEVLEQRCGRATRQGSRRST